MRPVSPAEWKFSVGLEPWKDHALSQRELPSICSWGTARQSQALQESVNIWWGNEWPNLETKISKGSALVWIGVTIDLPHQRGKPFKRLPLSLALVSDLPSRIGWDGMTLLLAGSRYQEIPLGKQNTLTSYRFRSRNGRITEKNEQDNIVMCHTN